MLYLNDENCRLSIEEKTFHRNDPVEIDSYDFFCVDIQTNSVFFNFNLQNIEIYIFQVYVLIDGIYNLIKSNHSEFVFSLYYDVMNLRFQRSEDQLSYCVFFTLRTMSEGDFELNGSINMTNDQIIELFNNLKYFMSAYV